MWQVLGMVLASWAALSVACAAMVSGFLRVGRVSKDSVDHAAASLSPALRPPWIER